MNLVNIGYGNLLNADRMITVVSPDSAPVKRMVAEAKENGRLIDASCGKKTKAVILTDSNHIILTALTSDKLYARMRGDKTKTEENADEE